VGGPVVPSGWARNATSCEAVSTTVNTIFGLLFVVLAVVAVLPASVVVGGPQFWDDVGKKTRGTEGVAMGSQGGRLRVRDHLHLHDVADGAADCGTTSSSCLPARVFHAVAAITLGVILVTKISNPPVLPSLRGGDAQAGIRHLALHDHPCGPVVSVQPARACPRSLACERAARAASVD